MRRARTLLVVAGALGTLGFGVFVSGRPTSSAADGNAAAPVAATAAVERRTLEATTQVDGTLGFAGAYTIANTIATSGGADASSAQQARANAQSQVDAAAAALDALRNPTATDLAQARTQVAQAAAAVAQAKAGLAYDRAVLESARRALARCTARASAPPAATVAPSPDPSATPSPVPSAPTCDADALRLAVKQAEGAIETDQAQLAAARAGLGAAQTALDALRHPTADQVRRAEAALATARAQLAAATAAVDAPHGVLTQIAGVGSIVEPGGILYTLDRTHPVALLEGDLPAWRRLEPGMSDGPDIEQLEQNLKALGHASSELKVDEHWDDETTAAVKRWQKALRVTESGVIAVGAVVFQPGALRITAHPTTLGTTVQLGTAVLEATSTEPGISVALNPALQTQVKKGDRVSVTLPDGTSTPGRVSDVGTVARVPAGDGSDPGADPSPTIDVLVTLDDPSAAGTLDQAPVTVDITTATASDVLAVPVGALVQLLDGGYAVQIQENGEAHYVAVELGLFAGGWVEVSGEGLAEGQSVVVAQ